MRNYTYQNGPDPNTGRSIKVFEDDKVKQGTISVKVSATNFEEAQEFFTLLFVSTPANIEASKDYPLDELHIFTNPNDYDEIVSLFEDPDL